MMLAAALVVMGSCVGDDIDSLQDQIDNLEEQVSDLEAAQQAALKAQVDALMAQIEALQLVNEGQSADYDAMLADLAALELLIEQNADGIEGNENRIFFGDVKLQSQFDDLAAQEGASIITGSVLITKAEQAEYLANVTYIGGDLIVTGVDAADSEIDLPVLATVGGQLLIGSDWDITNIYADPAEDNKGLVSFTAPSLAFVSDLRVCNFKPSGGMGTPQPGDNDGPLAALDLGGTSVVGNARLRNIPQDVSNLILGAVGKDLYISYSNCGAVELNGNIGGNFTFYNNGLVAMLSGTIESIGGDVEIDSNGASLFDANWNKTDYGFTGDILADVTYIGGNILIKGNKYPADANINYFKSATSMGGNNVTIQSEKSAVTNKYLNNLAIDSYSTSIDIIELRHTDVELLNAVTMCSNIEIDAKDCGSLNAFNALTKVGSNGTVFNFENVTDLNVLGAFVGARYNFYNLEFYTSTDQDLCSMSAWLTEVAAGNAACNPTFYVDGVAAMDNVAFATGSTASCN